MSIKKVQKRLSCCIVPVALHKIDNIFVLTLTMTIAILEQVEPLVYAFDNSNDFGTQVLL